VKRCVYDSLACMLNHVNHPSIEAEWRLGPNPGSRRIKLNPTYLNGVRSIPH